MDLCYPLQSVVFAPSWCWLAPVLALRGKEVSRRRTFRHPCHLDLGSGMASSCMLGVRG